MIRFFLLLLTAACLRAADRPLNYIVMLVDDMGATDLGCTGSTFYQTPHIDQLARDGMKFTRAYSACTVCSPTRAALLTGQSPARLHITDWITGHDRPRAKLLPPAWVKEFPAAAQTLPELLKPRGYAAGTFGKWHLGNESPLAHGFEINAGGYHRGQPATWFSPYKNPALADGPEGEFLTERLTAEVEKFITAKKEQPFLVYYPHYAVHTPLGGKKDVIAKYQKLAKPDAPQRHATYASMVESVDDSVGRLRAKLRELKIEDRTVFIFTSDNGGLLDGKNPPTANLGMRAGKGSAYEGGVRVPLIIHWPGLTKPGSTSDTPVITMDLPVTLAAAAGTATTAPRDGTDLRPLLSGSPLPARPLYWHYPHYHPGGATPYSAVLHDGWRLLRFYETGKSELYHLTDDPEEKKDLVAAQPEKTKALLALLDTHLQESGAQMPVPNPAWNAANDRGE
jgi:arylsulfatase A